MRTPSGQRLAYHPHHSRHLHFPYPLIHLQSVLLDVELHFTSSILYAHLGPTSCLESWVLTILAHLNWVSIFLGFHSFGLYIHNDTLSALGKQTDLIWTALLNQLQRSYPRWSGSSVVPHIGTQLLETSYGNGSGNLPRTGNEASLH